jgi:hypothetical protein
MTITGRDSRRLDGSISLVKNPLRVDRGAEFTADVSD